VITRLLDVHDVAAMLGLSDRSVWRRVKDGNLPQPIYIGRLAKWRVIDINSYLDRKFQESNPEVSRRNRARFGERLP